MAIDGLADADIRRILEATRRVAVVGASPRPQRPSHTVFRFLVARGLEVVPVNPAVAASDRIDGIAFVSDLAAAGPLDLVDIFRAGEHVAPVVDEAIRCGARTIWMQLGVIDEASAQRARQAGLNVVMNRCPAIEWPRLGVPSRTRAPTSS